MNRALELLLGRAALASLAHLPRMAALRLGEQYATLLDRAMPRLRRTAYENLAFALPEVDPRAITDGVFRSIGRVAAALAQFPRITRKNVDQWIRYDGLEHYEEAKRRGNGVLFATAHLGNWELSAFAHGLMTEPMNVVVRPLDNRLIDELVESRRALSGNRIIAKKEPARAILRALHRNEAVGILIDQNAGLSGSTFVNFFGVPAAAQTAMAKLAAHSGAAVIPGFAIWSEAEEKYVLRFDPILPIGGDVQKDTESLQNAVESAVRRHPDQWLWIHRRWKTRPPGAGSLYSR